MFRTSSSSEDKRSRKSSLAYSIQQGTVPPMATVVVERLFDLTSTVLWIGFLVFLFLSLRNPLIERVIPRLTEVNAFGIGFSFSEVETLLEKASSAGPAGSEAADPTEGKEQRVRVVSRLEHAAECLKGGRILWVDDHPDHNRYLIRLFRELGMTVDTVFSTSAATEELMQGVPYDLVLSDLDRGGDPAAGADMPKDFRSRGISIPIIIHADRFDPELGVDPMIFGGTRYVGEVVHYVTDIMERIRLTGPRVS